MDIERMEDRKLAQALSSGSFSPDSDDMAFLGAVRHGVKVRRKQRAVRNSALTSLTVILLVVGLFQPWNRMQPEFGPLLTSEGMAALGLSDEELLDLTANYDDLFSLTGDDEVSQQVSSDLEALFTMGDVADPVAYLAGYDADVQDHVLEQLETMSIFDSPGQIRFSGEGEL